MVQSSIPHARSRCPAGDGGRNLRRRSDRSAPGRSFPHERSGAKPPPRVVTLPIREWHSPKDGFEPRPASGIPAGGESTKNLRSTG